jgi:hypothetical protein
MGMTVDVCPECGVPEPIFAGHAWLNNGDIVQAGNDKTRMVLIECENLDPLFGNIGLIIGEPIDPLIMRIQTVGTTVYFSKTIPEGVKQFVQSKQLDLQVFIDNICALCEVLGYGKYDFVDHRYEQDMKDYAVMRIFHPFSVPEAAGLFSGAIKSVVGGYQSVDYTEISPGMYELVARMVDGPPVLKQKVRLLEYCRKPGDIELKRCPSCGTPRAIAGYHWHPPKGIIVDAQTGRRLAMLGQESVDALFRSLEDEYGEKTTRIIVEAQRRFVKTGFYSIEEVGNEDEFRIQLALRGMGNLQHIRMGTSGMSMRIDNVSGHLLLVGMAQGLFENSINVDSDVDWELTKAGNLEVEVKPRGKTVTVAA